ncbi:mannose-1-phosphate guanylyltransferase [Nocardioides sp.]|uniref:mannose-1-phosphate guanylyltransferase n=1 Tax=Nocardioides sp. TaxID=35761 RepID=UPI002D80B7CE|nr:mannose-1-phosphate guanylyltransferase [Nocardioides sp.]HET8962122.1 mannose-1-phosphate guanylyltransferase [Nocardioides sp.]
MPAIENLWAVIPAGGAGTRLWPLSRTSSPKFLHDLTGGGRSLLQDTVARMAPLVDDRFLVVTGAAHREAVMAQLDGLEPAAVLAEPSPRDSMAAIGLGAALLERRDPEAVMGSFAADHVVTDPDAFADAVRLAVEVARDDWLVTIGIEPTHASTAFGYMLTGEPLADHPGAHVVAAFVEKPAIDLADQYLASGSYRWNAGMFVVRPGVLLDLLARWHPEFAQRLRRIAADPSRLETLWPTLPQIALDHAVAEPASDAGRVAVVPAAIGWEDIGDFDSLSHLLESDPGHLTVLGEGGSVRGVDSSGLVVAGTDRVISVVGLDDIVVVDTPDALLVTSRNRAQDVKQVVKLLRQEGRSDLT